MSTLTSESLREAKRVVSSLLSETQEGRAFQSEAFIQCLSEEIEDYWQSEVKEGLVHFHFNEEGSLLYGGIVNEMQATAIDYHYPIGVKENLEFEDISDTQLGVFTLLSSMKESHFKEKSKILESLDQISADFDKKLIEVIKQAKANKSANTTKTGATKVAEDYLNLDIATKKQRLLEKLLGEAPKGAQKVSPIGNLDLMAAAKIKQKLEESDRLLEESKKVAQKAKEQLEVNECLLRENESVLRENETVLEESKKVTEAAQAEAISSKAELTKKKHELMDYLLRQKNEDI